MNNEVVGVVAEFNPFHSGHKYLIDEIKKQEPRGIIAIMSGDFTQRGDIAIYDKWTRAKTAVLNGVNLVIQLPIMHSISSAEYFCKSSIDILEELNIVTQLAFGSESGDLDNLYQIANLLKRYGKEIDLESKKLIQTGISYPKARELCLGKYVDRTFNEPNDILAIEYLKNLRKLQPIIVKRNGKGHHQSASEIRMQIRNDDVLAAKSVDERLFSIVRYFLLSKDIFELQKLENDKSGILCLLKKNIMHATNLEELILMSKPKNYTYTRIRRQIMQTILGIRQADLDRQNLYTRVLAFDDIGARLIREIKKCDTKVKFIDDINKLKAQDEELKTSLLIESFANSIYLSLKEDKLYEYSDYVKKPYYSSLKQ